MAVKYTTLKATGKFVLNEVYGASAEKINNLNAMLRLAEASPNRGLGPILWGSFANAQDDGY
jgi:hypothetical protein